jgi:SAM-dependent methyltransferase
VTTHSEFYERVETYEQPVERHEVFIDAYRAHRKRFPGRAIDVLDVGCGEYAVLRKGIDPADRYFGIDVKADISVPLDRYASLDLGRDELREAWPGQIFDVVFCGEVIEHVFSPDRLLRQLASVMHDESLLVLSTPNLAYWVNRILLPLGLNPLFVENSSETVLGRRFKALGQGNQTQGHLRLFTHRAMRDLLARERFRVVGARSVSVWRLPGDRLIARFFPHFGADSIFFLQRPLAEKRKPA